MDSIESKFNEAIESGMCDVIDRMLSNGYVPKTRSLIIACQSDNINIVTKLLDQPTNYKLDIPLFIAVTRGNLSILNHLFLAGADVNCRYHNDAIGEHYYGSRFTRFQDNQDNQGNEESDQYFNEESDEEELFDLDDEQVEQYIEDEDLQEYYELEDISNGMSPLHIVTDKETLKWLLDMGATQMPDCYGFTPLHAACYNGWSKGVKLLLNSKDKNQFTHVNCPDSRGDTPLHVACYTNSIETVKVLLKHQADQLPNSKGDTPLHYTCNNGDIRIIKLLIKHGAQLTDNENDKVITDSALYIACLKHENKVAKFLLDHYVRTEEQRKKVLDAQDQNGDTILHHLCLDENSYATDLLLKRGASQLPNKQGDTPLHIACRNGCDIDNFLAYGGQQTPNRDGITPLHLALKRKDIELIKTLLMWDGQQLPDNEGNTPLHLACKWGDPKSVEALVLSGGKQVPNKKGLMPEQLVDGRKSYEIVEILTKCQRKYPKTY